MPIGDRSIYSGYVRGHILYCEELGYMRRVASTTMEQEHWGDSVSRQIRLFEATGIHARTNVSPSLHQHLSTVVFSMQCVQSRGMFTVGQHCGPSCPVGEGSCRRLMTSELKTQTAVRFIVDVVEQPGDRQLVLATDCAASVLLTQGHLVTMIWICH